MIQELDAYLPPADEELDDSSWQQLENEELWGILDEPESDRG